MDKRIIQYYEGELSNEEKNSCCKKFLNNHRLNKGCMDLQHVRSLMAFHPNEQEIPEQNYQKRLTIGLVCVIYIL